MLFVCTGNICRSPTAEGIALHLIKQMGLSDLIEVDSAGINGFHAGEPPDPRACKAAAERGYDLSALRARKLEFADFQRFDLILAMDEGHLDRMMRECPPVYRAKLDLFMHYVVEREFDEVPDPYYGGTAGFTVVLDLCERGVRGILETLRAECG